MVVGANCCLLFPFRRLCSAKNNVVADNTTTLPQTAADYFSHRGYHVGADGVTSLIATLVIGARVATAPPLLPLRPALTFTGAMSIPCVSLWLFSSSLAQLRWSFPRHCLISTVARRTVSFLVYLRGG